MFQVNTTEFKGMKNAGNLLAALGDDGPKALTRAVSHTGDRARTQVIRTLAVQTGLPQKTIRRSIKVQRPKWGSSSGKGRDITYILRSAGGNVSLKFFKKRETKDGVEAYLGEARGKELFLGDTFFKGGVFPRRRVELRGMGGHVYARVGGRTQLRKVKSGIFIPLEMVEGASAVAFEETVKKNLEYRVNHEINRILGS